MSVQNRSSQPYLTLADGATLPQLGFGTYKLTEKGEAYRAVRHALEVGYRLIDTAHFYGNEQEVGAAIHDSGIPREEIFLTTKVWNDAQRSSTQRQQFEESLQLLKMEYVDLLLIHWPVPGKYLETWGVLMELYKEQKAHSIGVSNFRKHHLQDLLDHSLQMPVLDQMEHHPLMQDTETLHFCKQKNIAYQAWSPLGRGKMFDNPTIVKLAEKYGKTPAQIVLRWDIDTGVATIPKSRTFARIEENFNLFDFKLDYSDVETINALNKHERVNPKSDPDSFDF